MQRYVFPGITLHISDDLHKEYEFLHARFAVDFPDAVDSLADHILLKLKTGFLRKLFDNEVLARVLKRFKASNVVILDAHGSYQDGVWHYQDGDACTPVQEWIDKNDQIGQSLILCCCNVASLTPRSINAILVVPDRNVGNNQQDEDGNAIFTLLHPKHGEIDSYTLDAYLPKSRKK